MIGIHPLHRQLAKIAHMATDKDGTMIIGQPELQLILPLLRQNLLLVQRLDELKQLSYIAYSSGEVDWLHDICRQIDAIEGAML